MRDIASRFGRRSAGEQAAATLEARLAGLDMAARVADGRLPAEVVHRARDVLGRASARRTFSADLTVVALAGATGSGKSSVFNALVGVEISPSGVRRPTTGEPVAASWGDSPALGPLLDWLAVKRWHHVTEPSSRSGLALAGQLPSGPWGAADLSGLVLLDLPDHDSTVLSHRERVDRLVERVDVMVWVLDPQKYADAAVHDRYLRRFARHGEVTVVLLHQVDRLDPGQAQECLADLRAILQSDGLGTAPVIATSTTSGAGLEQLAELIAKAVQHRRSSLVRMAADVATAADNLAEAAGDSGGPLPVPSRATHEELAAALAEAAGAKLAARAVGDAVRGAGRTATGWPLTRWLGANDPGPAQPVRLPGAAGPGAMGLWAPSSDPAALAGATAAVRRYAAACSLGAPDPWVRSSRAVAVRAMDRLGDELDSAMARCRIAQPPRPWWWPVMGAVQKGLLGVAALGALWLLALVALAALALPRPQPPDAGGLPLPTLMLIAGLLLGAVVGALAAWLNRRTADRAARSVERAIREEIAKVARVSVTDPIDADLATLSQFRVGLLEARG